MAQYNPTSGERTFRAGENLTEKQYHLVKLDTANQNEVLLASAATDPIIGVLLNNPAEGAEARVHMNVGTVKVIAGDSSIDVGSWVTADSDGKAIATVTDKQHVIGMALEAAGADGDIVEVALMPFTLSV